MRNIASFTVFAVILLLASCQKPGIDETDRPVVSSKVKTYKEVESSAVLGQDSVTFNLTYDANDR